MSYVTARLADIDRAEMDIATARERIRQFLYDLRLSVGVTQRELGTALGVGPAHISEMEAGNRRWTRLNAHLAEKFLRSKP